MPQGNAFTSPPGLWYQNPTTSSVPKLILKSMKSFAIGGLVLLCLQQYRTLAWKYTYTQFIGKTMTLGTLTTDTHEPLSTEEIDRLKAEEAQRKNLKQFKI